MGALYSRLTNKIGPEPLAISPVENVQQLTEQEMEREFEKIYLRSRFVLRRLSQNPCDQLTQTITQCLEKNSREMTKCFSAMDSYQACIANQRAERLVDNIENVEIN